MRPSIWEPLRVAKAKGLKLSEPGDCKVGEQERFDIMMCKSPPSLPFPRK